MTFKRRLKAYVFGILIGCALVAFFFKGRLDEFTSWLPGNRVLELLSKSEPKYTDQALCQLACFKLDTADVSHVKAEGDVRFKLSEPQADPKKYVVDEKFDHHKVRMTFATADSVATLVSVEMPEELTECNCD